MEDKVKCTKQPLLLSEVTTPEGLHL